MDRVIRRHGLVAEISGRGPGLMLIHGLGSSRHVWRPVLPALSQRFTTISVDLLGHGDASWPEPAPTEMSPADHADALKPLIEEFGDVHVVGNSMGGWVGLELAADGSATSLTALCPAGLEFDPWVTRSDLLVQRRLLAKVLGPTMSPLTQAVGHTPILRDLLLGDATADFGALDMSLLGDAATAMTRARGFFASHDGMLHTLFTRAEEVPSEVPVSIVWGTQDQLLPAARQRRVAGPAHADWIVFDDCAHVPMWDQPDKTIDVIHRTAQRSLRA